MQFKVKGLISGIVSISSGGFTFTFKKDVVKILSQEEIALMPHLFDEYARCGLIELVQVNGDIVEESGESTSIPAVAEPVQEIIADNAIYSELQSKKARIAELKLEIGKYKTKYKAAKGAEKKSLTNIIRPLMDELKQLEA